MRKKNTLMIPLLMSSAWASAHHSAIVHYDPEVFVTHENVTVVAWNFRNPHAELIFEAPHPRTGEIAEWSTQTPNVNQMVRFGYTKDSFMPGEVVTVIGNPARDGRPHMDTERIIRADGRVVNFSERASDAPPLPAVASGVYDGPRDFSGVWEIAGEPIPETLIAELVPEDSFFWTSAQQGPEQAPGETGGLPITEKARAFLEQWTPDYDECRQTTGWIGQSAPYLHEIEDLRGDRLHVRTEYQDQERTIWLDGRPHPPLDLEPRTIQGHSTGHWEGDTLVVETANMLPNQVTRNGIYHSENAVMTERISRDGDTITWVRVLEDPTHLTRPVASIVRFRRTAYPDIALYGSCIPQ